MNQRATLRQISLYDLRWFRQAAGLLSLIKPPLPSSHQALSAFAQVSWCISVGNWISNWTSVTWKQNVANQWRIWQVRLDRSWVHAFDFQFKTYLERDSVFWTNFPTKNEASLTCFSSICQIWMQPHLPCNILTVWAFEVQIHHMELSSRLPGLQELHVLRSSSPSTTNLSSTYSPRSPICPCRVCSGLYQCPCLCPTTRTTVTLV